MPLLKLNQSNEDFYRYLGPVFGSRTVEQQTHDRFYDDPGKLWYLIPGAGTASVLDSRIRNFWADDAETAEALILAMQADYSRLTGVLPRTHETIFRKMGFKTSGYRKNFMEVFYEED